MNDALYTEAGLTKAVREASDMGTEIDDDVARAIASSWHGGQFSAFYAFASSGHFDADGLSSELSLNIAQSYGRASEANRLELDMLGTYIVNRSIRENP